MYVLGLPACLRAALSRSVVGSHVGHTRAARGGAFGVERPQTPFQTIIGTRNRDRNMVAQRFLENRRWFARDRSDARSTVPQQDGAESLPVSLDATGAALLRGEIGAAAAGSGQRGAAGGLALHLMDGGEIDRADWRSRVDTGG